MIVYTKKTQNHGMIWARGIGANIACDYGLGLFAIILGFLRCRCFISSLGYPWCLPADMLSDK
ncbi:uncharacterized protein BDW70DRAFT_88270 [Aspergillus foveolatus]|uniref:uncharacterized protein n=1 Tax=Aspergillus foveolatus TaxID=210207 RepID=UPI003CCDB5AC